MRIFIMKMLLHLFVVIFYLFAATYGADEGEKCVKDGLDGTCINIKKCQTAIDDIRNRRNPQICTFDGSDPVVCCVAPRAVPPTPRPVQPTPRPVTPGPVATPNPLSIKTTTEYVPDNYDYQTKYEGQCEPLSSNLTARKTGQKAWDKCIEYQEKFVYPCEKSVALTGDWNRANHCHHSADELIVGGTDASLGEFPHMVLLGYGDDSASAQWLCGGTLLSEWFILTAGHCTSTRDFGEVTFAILGTLKRTDKVANSKLYKIKSVIKHPEFKPPSKYNDIALLKTETQMKLDQYAVPACLDVGKETKYEKAIATGWGALEYRGGTADNLQKVTLVKFSNPECSEKFPANRNMKQGFDTETQICYGDYTKSKDTCQGDSGGPLQGKNSHISCMYTIIGVTSFGRACGFVGEPGIYTRVVHYVPWIESVVWA